MRTIETVTDALDGHTYPATTAALIEAYGDLELEHPNGSETLGDVLARAGAETHEDAESARLAAISAVASGAIGRKGYSDRDPVAIGEDGPEQVSF
jgi:hypothetical protein